MCDVNINTVDFRLAVVYIPPNINSTDLELFLNALEILTLNKKIMLLGDFNVPGFSHSFSTTTISCSKSSCLKQFCLSTELKQLNNVFNSNGNLLDLVFVNLDINVLIECVTPGLVREDKHHPPLLLNLEFTSVPNLASRFPISKKQRYDFRRANFPSLYNTLFSLDWTFLEHFNDINLALDCFYKCLYEVLDSYVPKITPRSSKFPPWFSSDIKRNIGLKNYYRQKWVKSRNTG